MEQDVNEELDTSVDESSTENQEDESKETDESKDVPYTRFSKVVKERNELREQLKASSDTNEAVKEALTPKEEAPAKAETSDSLSREEAILYAKGYDDETVAKLKKIAAVEDTDLLSAADTDIFTAWNEKREAEARNQSAQLGASTGSAPHQEQTFKSGMTKEDHKALWQKHSQ